VALLATAFPILPGKTPEWRQFAKELAGPRKREFDESRRRHGVHERTFFQPTPMGDLVIQTLEGDDPAAAFAAIAREDSAFARWFNEQVHRVHGVDVSSPPPGPLPELIADSGPIHKG
jgi:hypothetical protein